MAGPARRTRAFTLVELILVMALLLIVLSLAAPSLSRFFRGRNLDGEARRLLALTRYGQSRAVSEGLPMVLWLNVEAGAYGLQADATYTGADGDTNAIKFEWDQAIEIQVGLAEYATNANLSPLSGTISNRVAAIRFLPDGSISDTSPSRLYLRETPDSDQAEDRNEDHEIWITQSRNRLRYEILAEKPPEVRR